MATIKPFTRPRDKDKAEKLLYVILRHGKVEVLKSTGEFIKDSELKKGAIVGPRATDLNQKVNTIKANLQWAYDTVAGETQDITGAAITARYESILSIGVPKLSLKKSPELMQHKAIIWNEKVVTKIDQELETLQQQKQERQHRLQELGVKTVNADDLLVTYFNRYTLSGKNKLATNTVRIYNTIAALLNRYNPDLRIFDVNRDTLQEIEDFMVQEGQLNQTIQAYMGKITAVLNYYGPDLDLHQSYKRYKFELMIAKNDVVFLHPKQLKDFLAYQKPYTANLNQPNRKSGRAYDRVVDIMLMLVSTGLRYSDIFNDFRQLIQRETDQQGRQREYILITPWKTRRKQIRAKIPVTKIMKEILERNNYQLKKMEDYYFNELLREYCQGIPSFHTSVTIINYCGKQEVPTKEPLCNVIGSRIGRKTFISYQFALGLSVPEIIGRSGHTEVNTLMVYAQKMEDIASQVGDLNFFALPD